MTFTSFSPSTASAFSSPTTTSFERAVIDGPLRTAFRYTTGKGRIHKIVCSSKTQRFCRDVPALRDRDELDVRAVVTPFRVERRGVVVRDDLVLACVVHIDRSIRGKISLLAHRILVQDLTDGRLVKGCAAERLHVGARDAAEQKRGELLRSADLPGRVQDGLSVRREDVL